MTGRRYLVTLALLGMLTLPAAAREPVYTDNVVIVLDGSGSMREKMARTGVTKMAAAKSALHEVLAQLPETTNVGIVAFSASSAADWLVPLGPQNAAQLASAIDGLAARGGTPLGRYMKMGADRLLQQRADQFGYGTYRLLVVTDGEADHPRTVNQYTTEIIARGITVDVIGVNMKKDHTLATRVHSYRRADDPESLRAAIADVFAEVSAADTSDAAGEDAFALLAPLPDDVAVAMVQALATSGNEPIGTQRAAPAEAPGGGSRRTGAGGQANQTSSVGLSIRLGSVCCVVVGFFVVFALVLVMVRRGRR